MRVKSSADNASKAAVVRMTKSFVNCVCPGFVETDMWTKVSREQARCSGWRPMPRPAPVTIAE